MNRSFKIGDIFNITAPLNDDLIKFEATGKKVDFPFVSRTSKNNGISNYVKARKGFLNKGNIITLALDGSTGSVFYQKNPFYSGQNIWKIEIKENFIMNEKMGLYLVSILRGLAKQSSYALNLTKTRLKNKIINLPSVNGKPNWFKINNLAQEKIILPNIKKIHIKSMKNFKFKEFFVKDIFEVIKYPKNRKMSNYEIHKIKKPGMIPFVSAKYLNFGVAGFISLGQKEIPEIGNVITISNNGSIGYAIFRDYEFISNNDVTILKNFKNISNSIENFHFVASALRSSAKSFSYGNKLKGDKLKNMKIFLPVTINGDIDEESIKNILSF